MRRRGLEPRRPLRRAVGHQIAPDVARVRHHGSHHRLLHLLLLLYLHGRHLSGLCSHGRFLDRLVRRHERGIDDTLHVCSGKLVAHRIRHGARNQVLDVSPRQRPSQARGHLLLNDPSDLCCADALRRRLRNRRHDQGVQLAYVDLRSRKSPNRTVHDGLNLRCAQLPCRRGIQLRLQLLRRHALRRGHQRVIHDLLYVRRRRLSLGDRVPHHCRDVRSGHRRRGRIATASDPRRYHKTRHHKRQPFQ